MQPSVTAHLDGTVAMAWYETYYDIDAAGEELLRMLTKGVYSEDLGDTLSAAVDLRPTNIDWMPCPRANGYYGHYWASAILPSLRRSAVDRVSAHRLNALVVDRTTSKRLHDTTSGNTRVYDHHVQSVVW